SPPHGFAGTTPAGSCTASACGPQPKPRPSTIASTPSPTRVRHTSNEECIKPGSVQRRVGLVFGGAGFGFGADRLEPHGLGAQADVAELLADVRGGPAGFCPVAVTHVPERLIGQGPDVHRVGLGDGCERVVPGGAHFGGVAAGLGADRFAIVAG